ncbi:UDP-glycosyltransferase 83A1-like [Cornus florida]|uniref:UDP-glycosyltransferase 83A1-like n=1 Tax=Cornus florida TaxID=4283 RepID=UPI0028A2B912|nr:UDP-glycosyltransferase 83A1-like [Cornus florida]
MGKPHVLAVPSPAQGHVIPLMELAQRLITAGFSVTFVDTEFDHRRVTNAFSEKKSIGDEIHLVSIPDGLASWEDKNDLGKLWEATFRVMPAKLEELIVKINESDGDESMGWALEVAEKLRIRRAAFWPAAAAMLALEFSIPKLIDDRIINNEGYYIGKQLLIR